MQDLKRQPPELDWVRSGLISLSPCVQLFIMSLLEKGDYTAAPYLPVTPATVNPVARSQEKLTFG